MANEQDRAPRFWAAPDGRSGVGFDIPPRPTHEDQSSGPASVEEALADALNGKVEGAARATDAFILNSFPAHH